MDTAFNQLDKHALSGLPGPGNSRVDRSLPIVGLVGLVIANVLFGTRLVSSLAGVDFPEAYMVPGVVCYFVGLLSYFRSMGQVHARLGLDEVRRRCPLYERSMLLEIIGVQALIIAYLCLPESIRARASTMEAWFVLTTIWFTLDHVRFHSKNWN